jgi:hypothetical protein
MDLLFSHCELGHGNAPVDTFKITWSHPTATLDLEGFKYGSRCLVDLLLYGLIHTICK